MMNEIVQGLIDGYRDAVAQKDLEQFLSLYAADVKVFDTWGRWLFDGREAWKSMPVEWFRDLGDETVRVEHRTVSCCEWTDSALWIGDFVFIGQDASGTELHRMTNRWTWVIARRPEGWRIIHEHSSLPVDMPTMRGLTAEA